MGGFCSKNPKIAYERGAQHRKSTTETKINQALLKKKMEHLISNKPISFEKILLRFDKLRVVLGYVKAIFNEIAHNGKLDHEGLKVAMKRLDVNMNIEEILDLFDFIDVQETHVISIKEFLVALTIGMVLDVIPALHEGPENTTKSETGTKIIPDAEHSPGGKDVRPMIKRSFSGLMGHNHEIKEMLNLIVSAYLIFDPDGKGYIERKNVESMLEEHGRKQGKNAMLSQQRWAEMVSSLNTFV